MGLLSNVKAKNFNLKKLLADNHNFRVAIFGSARTKRGDAKYREVFDLARRIGENGYDIVTGGGPGMMEAANAGHEFGDVDKKAESIGLIIELPFESEGNKFLELSKTFKRFSKRLDTFLELSHVMIVTQGGIGTVLELYYMWQHLQVKHVDYRPIILIGEMWESLIEWMKKDVLPRGLVSPKDFDYIYIAKNNDEAMKVIEAFDKQYSKKKKMSRIELAEARGVKKSKKATAKKKTKSQK